MNITKHEKKVSVTAAAEPICSDNGPEFIAYAIWDWLAAGMVGAIYITPGSPWENAYAERFQDKWRDKYLNRGLFGSLREAQVIMEQCRLECNQGTLHSSLCYRTPSEYAAQTNPPDGGCTPLNAVRSLRQAFERDKALPRGNGKQATRKTT